MKNTLKNVHVVPLIIHVAVITNLLNFDHGRGCGEGEGEVDVYKDPIII